MKNNQKSKQSLSRRKYVTAVGAAAASVGIAGCSANETSSQGGSTSSSEGGSTLELQHWWTAGGDGKAMSALLSRFNEMHPEIEIQENPVSGAGGQNLHSVIQDRTLNGNPPSTWQDWPGANLQPYVEADALKDLGEDVWTDDLRDAYLPGVKTAARAGNPDNPLISVPLNVHRLNNLFYNIEVFEEAGVDPSNMETPSDLVDAMATIESETDAAGMGQETSSAQGTLQLWAVTLMSEAGVETYEKFRNGETDGIEDDVRGALETVAEYKNHYTDDAGSINQDEAGFKVANGKAACMHQGDWQAGNFGTIDDFAYKEDWDHMPFPGTDGYYQLVLDGFVHPVPNPSPEATTEFLKFVGTVEAQELFNPPKGSIPPRTDVPQDSFTEFQQKEMEQFSNSEAQPLTMAHGLGVPPSVRSSIIDVMSRFTSGYDVESAQQELVNAVSEV